MMNFVFAIAAIGFVVYAVLEGRERSRELESLARNEGLTDIRRARIDSAIEGRWRGYRTYWHFLRRGRSSGLVGAEIYVRSDSTLSLGPRLSWSFTPFSGPVIEQTLEERLVVRGGDRTVAERLLGDTDVRAMLASLTKASDEVTIASDVVRVERGRGDSPHETLLEAFRLAAAIVEKLELPPR